MSDTKNGPGLHPTTVELANGPNYAAITTVLPSGNLQTQYIWVHTDGERPVVNTEVHRQKYKNVERDQRVTLTIRDEENPYRYAEVRGGVAETVGGQEARDHIDQLSQKYHDQDYNPDDIKSERVMLLIVPDRQTIAEQGRRGPLGPGTDQTTLQDPHRVPGVLKATTERTIHGEA